MSCCFGENGSKKDSRTSSIDKKIKLDKQKEYNKIKLLLLGTGGSGKSTIAKQLKIIHKGAKDAFSMEELLDYKHILHLNTVKSMKVLVKECQRRDIKIPPYLESDANFFSQCNPLNTPLDLNLTQKLFDLWKSDAIREVFNEKNSFNLPESAEYCFQNLERFSQPEYIPSIDDVLRARQRTTGIIETVFQHQSFTFTLVDVGGQRSERRKWIYCLAKGTPVTLANGLSLPIDQLYQNNSTVLGWSPQNSGVVPSKQANFWLNGERECIEITLEDGRILTCTPDHRILTSDGSWVQAKHLQHNKTKVTCSLRGVFVHPKREMAECIGWCLRLRGIPDLECTSKQGYERSMAFSRILGYILLNGYMSQDCQSYIIFLRDVLDVQQFEFDIFTLVGVCRYSHILSLEKKQVKDGSCCYHQLKLKGTIIQAFFSLRGIAQPLCSSSTRSKISIPDFVMENSTPRAFKREFLAGVFSGDEVTSPSFHSCKDIPSISFSQKKNLGKERYDVDMAGKKIKKLLSQVGVDEVTIDVLDEIDSDSMVHTLSVTKKRSAFSKKVGFRYCCKNSYRLECALSFKKQKESDIKQIMNRYHFKGIIPTIELNVVSKRNVGLRKVYDIEVEDTHSFAANGVLVHNCFSGGTITALLYCVAMDEYDMTLIEDDSVNRMHEALDVFEEVVNGEYFTKTSVILFLNKSDLFRKKIRQVDLKCCFKDYTGGRKYEKGAQYLKKLFLSKNHYPDDKQLYPHITVGINTENIKFVFDSVKDIIFADRMRNSGLIT